MIDSRQFFFEKKNQKTFANAVAAFFKRFVPNGQRQRGQQFFVAGPARPSFFQKRRPSFLPYGFTLIEVVIALAIFGFVLAGLAQATRFGAAANNLEGRLAENAAQLERMDRVLRQLIEQASPPVTTDDKPFAGEEHRLTMLTLLPDEPQTQPNLRHAQVALGVDDRHQLVLRWRPHPNASAIGLTPPMQEIVLAEGVARIDLAYRAGTGDGGKWTKTWTDGPLPALVQIHFVLDNGKHRWPDMAVATLLDTNGSF